MGPRHLPCSTSVEPLLFPVAGLLFPFFPVAGLLLSVQIPCGAWSRATGGSQSSAIEWHNLLPATNKLFRYVGSLTTPPCTEGVAWTLLEDPILLSSQQLETLMDAYWGNRRPTQQINGRPVVRHED